MIYTVTFNPAIDYVVRMDRFNKGEVNRTQSEEIQFGGKGINVSTVLTNLGVKSCALGFLAGFTGKAIEDGLKKIGVETDFIHLGNGMTRINVKLKADCESEINGQGPEISQQALDQLFEKLDCLKPGDILVLAGSIPKSLPSDIYEKIMQRMEGREIMVVVDATKDLLCNVLKYKPFLIKPNHIELGESLAEPLQMMTRSGNVHSSFSRGAHAMYWFRWLEMAQFFWMKTESFTRFRHQKARSKIQLVQGDSMVAGFLTGYLESKDYGMALKMGTATGSATAFADGLATREEAMALLQTLC